MAQVKLDVTVDSKQLSEFQGKLKELGANATVAGQKADKGLSFKGMIAGGAVIGLATKAVGVLTNSIGGAIQRVDTLNNANRAFQNMGFSAKQTDGVMNKLQGAIQGLPTPMNEAVSATQLLAASTGKAGKSADIYKSLNDSILGFGGSTEQVNEAVTQLSQAFSNGKVDGQTWNSMINAGMGPSLNALAKTMGMTTGEMKAGLSSGKISVEKFQDSLINLDKNGGGGMKSLSKIAKDSTAGIGTSMQNIKTAIVRGLANVIQPLSKPMAQALNAMIPMIDGVGKAIAGVMPKVVTFVQGIVSSVQSFLPTGKQMAGVFDTVKARVSVVFGAIQAAIPSVISIFQSLVAVVKPIVMIIAGVAVAVANFITSSSTMSVIVGIIQTVANVLKTLVPILQPVITAVGAGVIAFMAVQKVIAIFNAVKTAIMAVRVAMMLLAANPIGLIIAAVAALVAGFIYLWKTNEGFRNFFITAWNAIQQVAVTVWNVIKTAAMAVFNFLKPAITALITFWTIEFNIIKSVVTIIFNVIKTVVLGVFIAIKAIVTGFVAFWTAVWSGVTQVATAVWNGITAVFTTVFNVIVAIVRGALAIILGIWFLQFNIIKNVVVTVFNAIAGFLAPILAAIGKVISAAVRVISAGWKAGWNAVKSVAQAVWNVIRSVVTTYINSVRAVITRVMNVIRSFFTAAWNALKRPVTSAWNAIKGAVTSGINTVKSVVQSGLNRVKSIFTSIWQSLSGIISSAWGAIKGAVTTITSGITSAFESVVGKMSDIGHRIVQGIAGGLRAAWGSVTSAISRLVGQIPANIRKLLGIHSPSRVTKKLGRFTAEGLAVGIADGSKASKKEAAKLATGTTKAMKRAMSKYKAGKISPGDYVQELKDLKKYGTSTKATTKRINESIAKVNKKAAGANRKTYNQMNKAGNKRKAGKGYTNDYSYLDQLKKIKKSSKATGATYESLNKKIATVQGSIKSQVTKAQDATAAASKKYVTTVKKINDQLPIDIQAANDEYNSKLNDLKNSIYSQVGLFDAVAKKAVSKSTLAKNLNDQVNQMTQWQANVAKIAKKVPAALTDELRAMGVGSSAEIKAMTQMSDKELQQYVALWNQKHNLANSEADIEIIPDKNTLNTKIQSLQDAASKALSDAQATLNSDLAAIGDKFKNIANFKKSGNILGNNSIQGIINGLKDKKKMGELTSTATNLAKSIEKAIRLKLKIHSPSRVMAQLGGFVGAGLTNGISDQIRTVQRASQKMAEAVINPVGNIKVNPKIQGLFDNTSVEKALGISGKLNASSNVNNYYNNVTHQSQTNTAGQEALSYLKAIADKNTTIDGSSVGKALAPYQSVANANRNGLAGRGIAIGNNI
ncbi:hypothetical protein EQG49_11215 [Periweissella cryptocerci]|uniref:Tape measure protein N-terminal domain-containing protein n=1 Tax=Periweissella cryptocerci TaxID=2506420 RepID=A0A4P6YW26_9LACO|nr:tape measure protein [Periweissella cryptocerci]QBO36976.1 hypothetical protein EQG49_11215 [Periweissella cryptocerci]